MNNFKIYNAAHETEIDIFGEIGEGWFDEGVTFQNIKAQLAEIKTSKIKLNISSLGGDVNDALVIYNLLKSNGAFVEANIMGFTASSATIIAMSADSVTMDENASFLVHNAWTGAMGNQHDLREVADHLESVDDKLINIYKAKTSMRKDTLANLMKEERWLDATEAKKLGFVDATYKPMKVAASISKNMTLINESKDLPNIVNKSNINMSTIKEELKAFKDEMVSDIKAVLNVDNKEVSEELLNSKVDEAIKAKSDALELKQSELIANKVSEFETKMNELNEKFDAEKLELQNSIEAKDKEINELKGTETKVEVVASVEDPKAEEVEKSEGEKILSNIMANVSAVDKLKASVK